MQDSALSGTIEWVSETREPLRRTFDTAADLYEAARPSYPEELFDDLVALAELEPGARLLEIGCATGKATRPLLERGFSVVCVEMGAQLAERARDNLAGLPVEIHVAPFEAGRASLKRSTSSTPRPLGTGSIRRSGTARPTDSCAPAATWRSGAPGTRSPPASIPSSLRFKRSTTRSARATWRVAAASAGADPG
jgi:SAM-dependent methyltransferase